MQAIIQILKDLDRNDKISFRTEAGQEGKLLCVTHNYVPILTRKAFTETVKVYFDEIEGDEEAIPAILRILRDRTRAKSEVTN